MSITLTNGNKLNFYTLTGRVISASKNLESRIHHSSQVSSSGSIHEGYTPPMHHSVSVNSETIEHQEIFIQDEHGRQHAINIHNWGVSCVEGNVLTFVTGEVVGKGDSRYLHIANHTTRRNYRPEVLIQHMCATKNYIFWKPFYWSLAGVPLVAFMALGPWLGALASAGYWAVWLAPKKPPKVRLAEKVFGNHEADKKDLHNALDNVIQNTPVNFN